MACKEKPGQFDEVQWDGQQSTSDKIAGLFNDWANGGTTYTGAVSGDRLTVSEDFSTFSFELGDWAVRGPYWGDAMGVPVNRYTDAQFTARFDLEP